LKSIDLRLLREQIAYVPQDVFLFSDTISNNIRFGMMDASDQSVETAAAEASVDREIAQFPHGYKTVVGERGVTLSGGQKQRLSIARALIKRSEIIIFDDCLSSVDAKTEKAILSNMYNALQDKTAIIITHRIFSLFDFDKIIVLEEGLIAEQGKHNDLLALNGYYAELYRRQQEGESRENGLDN